MVMSPEMIQRVLLDTNMREDRISQEILVPCLENFSIRNGLRLRDVRFCGGTSELGNDIEYYEVLGPDFHRSYTGIQVKKGSIGQSDASDLVRQAEQAFEKNIADLSSGQTHRLGRWIVAVTGSVSEPAKSEILKRQHRYAKSIHFWDGLRIANFIMEYYYDEFVKRMGVSAFHASSMNKLTILYDPDKPIVIAEEYASTNFQVIDITKAAPPGVPGVLITVKPIDKNMPSVICIIRSNIDEITIDSVQSQIQPYLLRLDPEDSIEAMVLDLTRPVNIMVRGYIEMR